MPQKIRRQRHKGIAKVSKPVQALVMLSNKVSQQRGGALWLLESLTSSGRRIFELGVTIFCRNGCIFIYGSPSMRGASAASSILVI